jgi:FMN phosphatase YigB (HAD superfamily)
MNLSIASDHVVRATDFARLLDRHPQAKLLSLDCFDTVLWRKVADPKQVFQELQDEPLFREYGITAGIRVKAERQARKARQRQDGKTEVTIEEIYAHALPDAPPDLIERLIEAELQVEERHLFAFHPAVELIRQARERGLPVVMVSDMYIHAHQLQRLVEGCLQRAGLERGIDAYYTSADACQGKGEGLLLKVAQAHGIPAEDIVHLGDNLKADYAGARACGLQGYHFHRFPDELSTFMRSNQELQRVVTPATAGRQALCSSWHAPWATLPPASNIQEMLGWYYLGPIIGGFVRGLLDHLAGRTSPSGSTKLVFMMRDGHLPMKAYAAVEALGLGAKGATTHRLDISRVVAIGIRLVDADAVHEFLDTHRTELRPSEMLRQLAFGEDPQAFFTGTPHLAQLGWSEFCRTVLSAPVLSRITANARTQRERFLRHIKVQVQPEPQDRIVLVDLGYAGTIQDRIETTLVDHFDCEVEGYYFALKDSDRAGHRKHGLIRAADYSSEVLELLTAQIQIFEQWVCSSQGSTVAYDAAGSAQREPLTASEEQRRLRDQIQTASLDFVNVAFRDHWAIAQPAHETARETAGLLARLLLQPTPQEMALRSRFAHDVNNGTQRTRPLTNPAFSRDALLRGGLISYRPETHKVFTTDLQAVHPMLAGFSLLKQRFGLTYRLGDFQDRGLAFKGVVAESQDFRNVDIASFVTHDGYRMALVKLTRRTTAVGINLGRICKWANIHSVAVVASADLLRGPGWKPRLDAINRMQVMEGEPVEPQLIRFDSPDGFLHVNLQGLPESVDEQVLALLYRPVADWKPSDTHPTGAARAAREKSLQTSAINA